MEMPRATLMYKHTTRGAAVNTVLRTSTRPTLPATRADMAVAMGVSMEVDTASSPADTPRSTRKVTDLADPDTAVATVDLDTERDTVADTEVDTAEDTVDTAAGIPTSTALMSAMVELDTADPDMDLDMVIKPPAFSASHVKRAQAVESSKDGLLKTFYYDSL